uniref:Cysteine-rich receptor-like protein kinase 25 n=1 Tax=Anthurium amnicola TaxID=1678845 RepID=A0A1D1YS88_9ARAE
MATPILAILSSVILLNARGLGADTLSNTLLKSSCSGNSIPGSSSGDRFQTNLNTLLSSLKAQAPISNFNTTTAGDGADRSYGLYMCQGDLSSDDCRSCVQDAAAGVPQNCPSNRQGIVWYDYCQLRFSDFDFFGVMDASWGYYGKNEYATIPNPSLPLDVLSRLVEDAPSSQPLKFAANASVTAGVYALAQCTDDLSGKDCRKCLETILKEVKGCCSDAEGYRYLSRSCWVRYESTPFLWKVNSTYTSIVVPRCPNDTFPAGSRSTWEANLKVLLSSLATSSPRSGGFNTSVAGEGSTRLYGLALCRPDVANSTDACRTCLTNANSSVTLMCPGRTEGVIWYEKCEIRYSNQSFFGVVDRMGRTFCNPRETSQAYDAASLDLMSRLTEAAPNQPLLYAAGSEAISDSAKSYGLVQCTRDLSSDECRRCLTDGMANVCSACKQRRGWRYLSGSCNLRYEDFAFFDDSKLLTVPSSLGGGKSSKTLIIAIVIPILGTMILGSLIYFSWQRKKRHQGGKKTYLLDDLETLGDTDLHLIDLETVKAATDNFSHTNKIGKGGFGTVYKVSSLLS